MLNKKHLEKFNAHKLTIIVTVSFFIALEAALLAYITSSFLKQYIDIKYLGYVFVAANIISAVIILQLSKWVVKLGRYRVFLLFFVAHIMSLIGLVMANQPKPAILFFLIYIVTLFIIYIGIDIFTETFSCDDKTGCIKGKQLTVRNLAWVAAPIISGALLAAYNFKLLFFIAAIIGFVALTVFLKLKGDYRQDYIKIDLTTSWQKIKKNKNLFNIIITYLWLEIFFASMVIYTPLYLQQLGLDWSQIGFILTIMLTSFIIFQYPAGWLADNKYGEKEILMFGLLVTGITTSMVFYIGTITIWVWTAVLFANRFGACLVQVMSESYFYKQIDARDIDLINSFRLMRSLGYIMATLIASIILIFYPLPYIFLFLGLFMLMGLWFAAKIEDTQ
jgi:MFS family permease